MSEAHNESAPAPGRHCATCGAAISSFGPAGTFLDQCPECLLGLGITDFRSRFVNGTPFGEYKLVRQIGRGAMGAVYEAVQVSLGRRVALKMLLDANLDEPAVRHRFKIEAEAAAKLEHPNIVPVYGYGDQDGEPFLAMQFVQGETLKEKIRRGELCLAGKEGNAKVIARFMAKVCRAVAHAHERNVLHRDLKPANILVDAEGQPRLTDFGLAKILEEPGADQAAATLSGAAVGTPSYMAPEHANGGSSSKATDIYSLGAILYEMLTGRPPFKAKTALETIRLATQEEPEKPRGLVKRVPKDLETICLKCLEKIPAARYGSADAVAEDLERWVQAKPILARPVGVLVRLPPWSKRNPVGTALILLLCAGLVLSLALLREKHQREVAEEALGQWTATAMQKYEEEIRKVWLEPDVPFVRFPSQFLAALVGQPKPTNSLSLTFGMEIKDPPFEQAYTIAPVLQFIETRMRKVLGQPVAFDLILQKHRPDVAAPSINKNVDFQRLGPLAYVTAKETSPGLQLLAREIDSELGVIFARKDVVDRLHISNLAGIKGLRVACAHSNSIVSFAAKLQMARAGITAKDLSAYECLDPPQVIFAANPSALQFAHSVVIDAVLTNGFDVGEAREHQFSVRRHQGVGLVRLEQFPVPARVYIANAGVKPAIAAAFRTSLLELKSQKEVSALRKMLNDEAPGFESASDQDLNYIRSALTNEIRRFEARD